VNKKIILVIAVVATAIGVGLVMRWGAGSRMDAPAGKAAELLAEAKKSELQGDLLGAKNMYQQLVGEFPNARPVMDWQKKIEDLTMRLLFSPVITAKSVEYEVKPGDSLEKIAREHKTTVELIKRSNNLSSENIFPGKKLKVWTAPFSVVVDKSQNTLILKSDEEIFKTYTIASGTNNSTPVGTFKIIEKLVNPPWYKPGGGMAPPGSPENILGTRWMGLNKEGYGIHGTTEPKSLGTQSTAGCIRMLNAEVEELYGIVPQGTEVTIVD